MLETEPPGRPDRAAAAVSREKLVEQLDGAFDVLVIGGGATGVGTALDSVTRGYRTALVEGADFASATSSRSTKLIHGGVRYLASGAVGLVREALRERSNLRRNAPHLVDALGFICPVYRWFDGPYYFAGLKAYDVLAGASAFPGSSALSRQATLTQVPDLRRSDLHGSIKYYDGQFDDARLALTIARTALDRGATVVNYVRALRLCYAGGRVAGAVVRDEETGRTYEVRAKAVVNATGIFADELRKRDDPSCAPLLSHSRGSHVVFARGVFRGNDALLVPKTRDGRVLFAVPWLGHVVVGTTDIPVATAEHDVAPTGAEIDFIIAELNRYLERPAARKDVLATFAGLRPLVSGNAVTTAKLSREHLVEVSKTGVVTIAGGKWTTYRKMAADTVDAAARAGGLTRAPSRTARLPLHGSPGAGIQPSDLGYAPYGADREELLALERADPALAVRLDPRLPYTRAQVVFAARRELARTIDDVLARRTRALFLDADAARAAAPEVAALLAAELGRDAAWQHAQLAAFETLLAAARQ
jgi:glycerol-3-phosphate dehydrogenase